MTAQSSRRKPTDARNTRPVPAGGVGIVEAAEARDGLRLAAAAQRQAFDRLERLCEEGFRFAAARLEENRSTLRDLAQSPDLSDRMTIWSRHVERTMRQYSDNLGTIAGICSAQARETVEDGTEAAQAAVAAVAEVSPSPIAEAIPPLPAAEPELPEAQAAEAAPPDAAAGESPSDATRH